MTEENMSNPKPNRLILLQPNFTYRIMILRLFVGATIAACRLHAQNDITLTTLYYFGDADGCQPERLVLAAMFPPSMAAHQGRYSK